MDVMAKQKSAPVRIKENTQRLIRMYAGELQLDTGENFSDDDAIYALFEKFRPDLIERLQEMQKSKTEN